MCICVNTGVASLDLGATAVTSQNSGLDAFLRTQFDKTLEQHPSALDGVEVMILLNKVPQDLQSS